MKLSTEEMLSKFAKCAAHGQEVRRLSMMIFDEVSEKLLEMPNSHRKILESAALLHDIGYYIESKSHNKHSQQLILDNGLAEFDAHETKLVACVSRFHRGNLPNKDKHEIYCDLDKKDRKVVKRLGGILRLADGLETAHLALIKKVKIDFDKEYNVVDFFLTPNTQGYFPDISCAIRKRDLFELGFKTQSLIKFQKP